VFLKGGPDSQCHYGQIMQYIVTYATVTYATVPYATVTYATVTCCQLSNISSEIQIFNFR